MRALLWKDYRHSRPVLAFGALLLFLPYAWIGGMKLLHPLLYPEREPGLDVTMPWHEALFMAAFGSLAFSVLTVTLLAGHAIAGERQERSAEFLRALPVSPRAVLGSKTTLALGASLAIWAGNTLVLVLCVAYRDRLLQTLGYPTSELPMTPLIGISAVALLMFGSAWLMSAVLRSSAIAFAGGVAAPMVLGALTWLLAWATDPHFWTRREAEMENWFFVAAFVLGTVNFLAGRAVFLWRSGR